MSDTIPSPILGLPVPNVDQAPGPQWATDINNCMAIIDAHAIINASSGSVTPAGIDINADLLFNNFNATLLRSVRFQPQSTPLNGPSDLACAYSTGTNSDLYYNDGNGNNIQITANGGIAGTSGSISNLTSPASASYVAANETFVWQSAANTSANLDAASILLRNLVANSKALTLQPPAAMGANYSLTLPPLPVSTQFMQLDSTGNITASGVNVNKGITNANIANQTITTPLIAPNNVTLPTMFQYGYVNTPQNPGNTGPYPTGAIGYVVQNFFNGQGANSAGFGTDYNALNIILTTQGRPVQILVTGTDWGTSTASNTITPESYLYVSRGTTQFNAISEAVYVSSESQHEITASPGAVTGISVDIPVNYTFIDTGVIGVPGTYQYGLYFGNGTSSTTVSWQFVYLIAWEI